ncbi:hypothetical protein [Blautia sp. MSJ-19]|uniref:hypothetical protein n=1 Tax=Blautia sp. MSJ-19 TaxID=2841517 RepID=UPI001C0E9AD7|nr:hypothetical protein [Blautia sp. MSJ-19]MBU5482390.1 hypothetical protein [Blautia sp. MSJ-19]
MFRKKYLAAAGFMILAVAAAGCGKKNDTSVIQPTPTPVQEEAVSPTPTTELVNMEATVEKNIMGEKTSTASKVTIVNQTGSEIAAIYIRETPSDEDEEAADEWGDDLVNGSFTLKSGENAVYYYEKPSSSTVTYDIRISYTDEEKNECFFRNLPLTTIKQLTLRMDGKDDDAIPYATYMTANSTREVSTLNDVKKRLGLEVDEEDSDSVTPTPSPDSEDNSSNSNNTPSTDSDNNDPSPTSTPSDNDGDNTNPTDSTIQTAEGYIGMSIDDLVGAVGGAQSSEYEEDAATGTTGYYYYSNFTVSTSVDEDGNEIVTGVW